MTTWDWDRESLGRLAEFLSDKGITRGGVSTRAIGDGHSNLTFMVTDETGKEVIVRRPPPPPTPPGAHDMLREARWISALSDTSVPVAACLATAEAGEVIDVHFYVMSFAKGPVVTTVTPAPLNVPGIRKKIGESLIDTLAELHRVDWQVAGLSDMGRPEGFNARHIKSMSRLIFDQDGNTPAHFSEIQSWLMDNVPPESGASIIHNDYRIGNVILSAEEPGSIAAVLDWELATLGDPLCDLGYFLSGIPDREHAYTPTQELATAMLEEGYPTRDELAARYAQKTGSSLSNLNWYTAMVQWKLACLYEYGYRRASKGIGDPYFNDQNMVQSFLNASHRAAGLAPPPPAI